MEGVCSRGMFVVGGCLYPAAACLLTHPCCLPMLFAVAATHPNTNTHATNKFTSPTCTQVLGGGIDVVSIGLRTYIRSVPGEFNMDKNRVMELAQQQGCISAGAGGQCVCRAGTAACVLVAGCVCVVCWGVTSSVL